MRGERLTDNRITDTNTGFHKRGWTLCKNGAMPKVDESAKRWELDIGKRFGEAVLKRRKALKLSGVQVADRTKELGYPITRVALSKIENNTRSGKVDVAEWLVLSAVLEIPPALLLFPDYPDGAVGVLPKDTAESYEAADWLSGRRLFPARKEGDKIVIPRANPGVELVRATLDLLDARSQTLEAMIRSRGGGDDRMAKMIEERMAESAQEIKQSKAELWGESHA